MIRTQVSEDRLAHPVYMPWQSSYYWISESGSGDDITEPRNYDHNVLLAYRVILHICEVCPSIDI